MVTNRGLKQFLKRDLALLLGSPPSIKLLDDQEYMLDLIENKVCWKYWPI